MEKFVKIVIDLPDAELGVSGEGVWSVQVGEDLYEVRNSPWYSMDINFLDIVRAISPAEDKKPVVKEVFRRSGHRTIRVLILNEGLTEKDGIFVRLKTLGATYENANGAMFALDLKPEVDFDLIANYLGECETKRWLEYSYAPQPQARGTGDLIN
jgi:hypothetical protein